MWGIGLKREAKVKGNYKDVSHGIYEESNLVKKWIMFFGIPFKIFEKTYDSEVTIEDKKRGDLGFKK